MSLAAETRRRANDHPFLVAALRADVCNYTAAARFLDVDGDVEAVATALRRYAAELPDRDVGERDAQVRVESGVGPVDDPEAAILSVGNVAIGPDDGDRTAIVVRGGVDARVLAAVLQRLAVADVGVDAAGVGDGVLVVVVPRRSGADALRSVERGLAVVPE